jgi:hypothetical protein
MPVVVIATETGLMLAPMHGIGRDALTDPETCQSDRQGNRSDYTGDRVEPGKGYGVLARTLELARVTQSQQRGGG